MDYTIGISETLKKIFAGIMIGEVKEDNPMFDAIISAGKVNFSRFVSNFPSNIFQDEYAVFYSIMHEKNTPIFDRDQLRDVIDNNRDLILDSPYINFERMPISVSGNTLTSDERIEAMTSNMIDLLEELSNRYVAELEFNSACEIFISYFKNQYMLQTSQNMSRIMSDEGYEEKTTGKRTIKYHGFDASKEYYNKRMKILNEISDTNRVRSTVINQDWFLEEQQKENQVDEKSLMTIGLKKADETVGELRRSNMLGILGPPKGGKTRFTNYLVQRALSLGLNVCVWPLEGTKEEWISMQLSSYIARKYGQYIDSKSILQRKYNSPQERNYVQTAKFEMVTDTSLGVLSFIESTAYVEDFISILESHYENDNPFDVIVIDSLVNILSRTGRQKVDRISSAYMELKSFISTGMKRSALAIIPAQLKQDVVDYLRAHPNETIDVTSGGESAETIRTPDEVIGLFSSKEERSAGYMKIYSVASRHSGSFDDFQVRTQLKCCHFFDEE